MTFPLNFHVRTEGERELTSPPLKENGVQVAVTLKCGSNVLAGVRSCKAAQRRACPLSLKAISRLSLSLSLISEHSDTENFPTFNPPPPPPIYSHPIFRNNLTFPTATSGERTSK